MAKMFQIKSSWKDKLKSEFKKEYMVKLEDFLSNELAKGKIIYPQMSEIFQALNKTDFESVRVVIIGQDPYHGPGQAHGMCFSVKPDVKIPPSLVNIYKELEADLKIPPATHGHLMHWAEQGVLLLNAVLTVEKGKPNSHRNKGWEIFTDKIIQLLNIDRENIVFLLWGSPAQKKAATVDPDRHLVLKTSHPSPFSVYRGFSGCRHFSKTNDYLKSKGIQEIDWKLPGVVPERVKDKTQLREST